MHCMFKYETRSPRSREMTIFLTVGGERLAKSGLSLGDQRDGRNLVKRYAAMGYGKRRNRQFFGARLRLTHCVTVSYDP